mgnify:CR=1 FL=1
MNINDKYFCVVPFVQLNTRGKGDARVCCSISGIDFGIPKDRTLNTVNAGEYDATTPVYNLGEDTIQELWNSDFMRDFRMKMIQGEHIPNCEFCHRMEASGLTSKRITKNKKFLDKVLPLLEQYKKDKGYVEAMPQWWEIRLSTKCNLSCIMCSPNLSSMMFKEYSKWEREGTASNYMKGSLIIAKDSGEEYLSKSEFFKEQVLDNLEHAVFMEFRGGEVFADRDSIEFIRAITETEHAKNITLDISTNATLITDEVVDILNKFKGGILRFSIDAYGDEDELIRYHTDWNTVKECMLRCNKLKKGFRFLSQTTVQSANCTTLNKLIEFFDDFIQVNKYDRFDFGFTTVRGKDWMRHEMIPNSLRDKAIKKLKTLKTSLYICINHKKANSFCESIDMLISTLKAPEYPRSDLHRQAIEFYNTLSQQRDVNYYEKFPCLESLRNE